MILRMTEVYVFCAMLIDLETVATPRLNLKSMNLLLTSRLRTLIQNMNSADPLYAGIRVNLEPSTSLAGRKKDALPLVEPGDVLLEAAREGALAPGALAVDDVGGCEEGAVGVATAVDGDLTHCDCLLACSCRWFI
jgi:hypothetical protein